jgi:hypothetical protein
LKSRSENSSQCWFAEDSPFLSRHPTKNGTQSRSETEQITVILEFPNSFLDSGLSYRQAPPGVERP